MDFRTNTTCYFSLTSLSYLQQQVTGCPKLSPNKMCTDLKSGQLTKQTPQLLQLGSVVRFNEQIVFQINSGAAAAGTAAGTAGTTGLLINNSRVSHPDNPGANQLW